MSTMESLLTSTGERRHNCLYVHSPGGTFHVIFFRSAVKVLLKKNNRPN